MGKHLCRYKGYCAVMCSVVLLVSLGDVTVPLPAVALHKLCALLCMIKRFLVVSSSWLLSCSPKSPKMAFFTLNLEQ